MIQAGQLTIPQFQQRRTKVVVVPLTVDSGIGDLDRVVEAFDLKVLDAGLFLEPVPQLLVVGGKFIGAQGEVVVHPSPKDIEHQDDPADDPNRDGQIGVTQIRLRRVR